MDLNSNKCLHCIKDPTIFEPREIGECYEHCSKREDGAHKADPNSIVMAKGADFIVDVNCVYCGSGGSARISEEDIQWN